MFVRRLANTVSRRSAKVAVYQKSQPIALANTGPAGAKFDGLSCIAGIVITVYGLLWMDKRDGYPSYVMSCLN